MSYIGHRCTKCGHPDLWRLSKPGAAADRSRCECGCRCAPAEAAVHPTWDLGARPVERIVAPGDRVGGALSTCRCDGCKALYERLAGAA